MTLQDVPGTWPSVGSTDLHRDDWVVALRSDTIHPPDEPGNTFRRLVLEHPGSALVLAVDDEDRVCLIKQYRHPAGGTFVEIPAGLCDVPGEDPVETARRELREEAGLEAGSWEHLLTTYPSTGISAEVQHFYLARDLRPADPAAEGYTAEHEEARLEVFWAPLDEVVDAVLDGRVCEGPLAVAVLAHDARRGRSRG